MFLCPAHNFFWDWHWLTIFGTWMYHHQTMCRVHSWSQLMLTFDLKVKFVGFCHVFMSDCNFCKLWHWHIIFGTWVYHYEKMCQVHSWSWYDLEHWPQGQIYRVCDMALCSGLSFFVLWRSHNLFGTWVYHHGTMCRVHSWTLYDIDLWPQHYIFTMDLSLVRCLGIPNFGIWVYHHKTTCCVHSWP